MTASTGEHRKGGTTNQGKYILIDLSYWKKIDLIYRRNRVCRVKRGVTYSELAAVLAAHGMTIPMPLAPRDGKSVLAAVMDREPSTWANKQWDGGDLGSGGTFESGHPGYLEGIILYDPGNPRSAMAARELVESGARDAIDKSMGVPIAAFGVEANRVFGPACGNYDTWLRRIRAALDPHTASDPFFYAERFREKESI